MRTKAAYKDFEDDPGLEFEFYLADRLGRTVAQLRRDLTCDEFLRWTIYHARIAQRQELARKVAKR